VDRLTHTRAGPTDNNPDMPRSARGEGSLDIRLGNMWFVCVSLRMVQNVHRPDTFVARTNCMRQRNGMAVARWLEVLIKRPLHVRSLVQRGT
jgi:hypothetical protein